MNDRLGHDAGDALLKEVAARLLACLRAGDTAARLGGDEFVILLPEISDVRDAEVVAQKALQVMGGPVAFDGYSLRITLSVGVAISPAGRG